MVGMDGVGDMGGQVALKFGFFFFESIQLQSTLPITDLAIPDPLLYQTDQRLQDFTPANYPSLYWTAIQYRTGQSVKVFISLFSYISPLL